MGDMSAHGAPSAGSGAGWRKGVDLPLDIVGHVTDLLPPTYLLLGFTLGTSFRYAYLCRRDGGGAFSVTWVAPGSCDGWVALHLERPISAAVLRVEDALIRGGGGGGGKGTDKDAHPTPVSRHVLKTAQDAEFLLSAILGGMRGAGTSLWTDGSRTYQDDGQFSQSLAMRVVMTTDAAGEMRKWMDEVLGRSHGGCAVTVCSSHLAPTDALKLAPQPQPPSGGGPPEWSKSPDLTAALHRFLGSTR